MDADKLKAELKGLGLDISKTESIKRIVGEIRLHASYTRNHELGRAASDYMLELDLNAGCLDNSPGDQ